MSETPWGWPNEEFPCHDHYFLLYFVLLFTWYFPLNRLIFLNLVLFEKGTLWSLPDNEQRMSSIHCQKYWVTGMGRSPRCCCRGSEPEACLFCYRVRRAGVWVAFTPGHPETFSLTIGKRSQPLAVWVTCALCLVWEPPRVFSHQRAPGKASPWQATCPFSRWRNRLWESKCSAKSDWFWCF